MLNDDNPANLPLLLVVDDDLAMHLAKENGKSTYHVFSEIEDVF